MEAGIVPITILQNRQFESDVESWNALGSPIAQTVAAVRADR